MIKPSAKTMDAAVGAAKRPGLVYERRNSSLIAAEEGRVLSWLADRLPAWASPDLLTCLGVTGAALSCAGYILADLNRWWLVLAIFGGALNWFGDSLDGTIARLRRIERPRYGHFTDQTMDAFSMILVLVGMGLSPWIRVETALAGLAAYLLVALLGHLRASVTGVYEIACGGIGGTEFRIALVLMTTAMLFVPPGPVSSVGAVTAFDLLGLCFCFLAVSTYFVESVRQIRTLRVEDQLTLQNRGLAE